MRLPVNPVESPAQRTVFLESFGCQMNKLDSELVLAGLRADGYVPTDDLRSADVILFNTCSVRDHAEEKVRSRLGLLRFPRYRKPGSIVGILGCMAQREGANLFRRSAVVDLIVGPRDILDVPRLLREIREERECTRRAGDEPSGRRRARRLAANLERDFAYVRDVSARSEPWHAYVSIMQGCDLSCTYCIVPHTRGPEASRPIDAIEDEVRRLCDDGVREVMLLGQTVNSWGKGLPGAPDLAALIERLDRVPGLERLRFITSHPALFPDDFFRRIAQCRSVCEYLHMPVQSGSDRVLKRMLRRYKASDYRAIVDRARRDCPGIEVASDVIVGFPGETDDDFQATCDLVREIEWSQCFVFKYSPRPGTPATRLPDDVPEHVKRERNNEVLRIQEEICLRQMRALAGKTVEILVEGPSRKNENRLSGRTRTHRIVLFEGPGSLQGELIQIAIESASAHALYGTIASRPEPRALRTLPLAAPSTSPAASA